jgi:ATP-dependent exoDNAse (exonuclease V) beta subunit
MDPKPNSEWYEMRIDELMNEIDRLKKELINYETDAIHTCHDFCQRKACVTYRELEKLKAKCEEVYCSDIHIAMMKEAREQAVREIVEWLEGFESKELYRKYILDYPRNTPGTQFWADAIEAKFLKDDK